jgi:hypothetical protein
MYLLLLFLRGWLLNSRIIIVLGNKANRAPLLGFYCLALQTLAHFSLIFSPGAQKTKNTGKKSLADRFFSEIESAGRSIAVLSSQQVAGPDQRSQEERIERDWEHHSFRLLSCYPAWGPSIC